MDFSSDLKYTEDHEWIRVDGQFAYVGITEFAQQELGDIVYVDINTVGKEVTQGSIFGTVEAVKTVSDLFMPITGKIIEVNEKLDTQPELLNSDPYGDGWMVKIDLIDSSQLENLLSSDSYKKLIGS